jgi:hypothetical protein
MILQNLNAPRQWAPMMETCQRGILFLNLIISPWATHRNIPCQPDPAAWDDTSTIAHLANQNLGEAEPEPWVKFFLYSKPALGKWIAMDIGNEI